MESGILEKYDVVIVDEAHTAQAEVLAKIIASCKNSEYRLGLSGTLCKNEELNDQLEGNIIVGSIGKTDMIVRPAELIARGILTPCKIVSILVQYDEMSRKAASKMKFQAEIEATSLSGSTINSVRMLIDNNRIRTSHNTVILVKNLKLLASLKEMLETEYPQFKAVDYHGKINARRREEIRKLLSDDNGYIVIASYPTFQAGINIPKIDNLVLGQGSSSPIRVRQSIGRILRKHKDKPVAFVYDIVDDLRYKGPRARNVKNNHSFNHYELRKSFYIDDEYPIVEVNSDFTCSFENMAVGIGNDEYE
jgi:superfamily II DNA or RNA helicase